VVSVVGDRLDGLLDGVALALRVSNGDDGSNTVVDVALLFGGGTARRWSIVCIRWSLLLLDHGGIGKSIVVPLSEFLSCR